MDPVTLARWQFGITTVYHFFFVPLTLGLVWAVALFQTAWVVTNRDVYLRLTKFWGKLFLINFAMGVVTGIVQEFQFGMNWSEYSRFVGDVFGAPLAIEALAAFFLESTFLGLWIFGWDRLPKKVHLATIWMVTLGSNVSAFWILVANSFMQQPLGYTLRNGRAEMDSFLALITNPHVFVQLPHVLTGAMATAAFFMLAISAWHLTRAVTPLAQRGVLAVVQDCGGLRVGRDPGGDDGRPHAGAVHDADPADEDGGGRGAVGLREPGRDVAVHRRRRVRAA